MPREQAAAEFTTTVRCAKVSKTPPKGERTEPVYAVELSETDGGEGKFTLKDVDESVVAMLSDGMIPGRKYELYVTLREKADAQTVIEFEKAGLGS